MPRRCRFTVRIRDLWAAAILAGTLAVIGITLLALSIVWRFQ